MAVTVPSAMATVQTYQVSKLFVSRSRQLSQHYGWANGYLLVVYNKTGDAGSNGCNKEPHPPPPPKGEGSGMQLVLRL